MTSRRTFLGATAALAAGCGAPRGDADGAPEELAPPFELRGAGPWGIATSHARSLDLGWLERVGATGISALRGYDRARPDASLRAAKALGFDVSGILQVGDAFPVDDPAAWEAHVASTVEAAAGRVTRWEVWNEPPNFSSDKRPESYAALVARAHDVVGRIDPDARVGLCAASVHLSFMERAILAGAAGHFDFVTLHPYETLSVLGRGFEPLFLSIVPTVRRMLAASSPEQAEVPVLFTELGRPVAEGITPAAQADALVKAFTLSIAQGVERMYWFEGVDGDSGPFGLIAGDGTPRPSYFAARRLIAHLGERPRFLGWLEVLGAPRAFAFEGAAGPVLVAWAPDGAEARFDFGAPVRVIDPRTGAEARAASRTLDRAPVLATDLPAELVERARANRGRALPWGGDFARAARASFATRDGARGLHPLDAAPRVTIDGVEASDHGTLAAHRFAIDPGFLAYDTVPLRISAQVRRTGDADAGFNLKYESIDGLVAAGSWNAVPPGAGWHTLSWDVDDARPVGQWGYHVALDSDSTAHSGYALRRLTVEKR